MIFNILNFFLNSFISRFLRILTKAILTGNKIAVAMPENVNDCVTSSASNIEHQADTLAIPFSQQYAAQIVSTRNYSLNINRTLRKRLQGCEEVKVEYEVTGDGVTGNLDTATFELLRLSCTAFFKDFPEQYDRCVIDFSEDKRRRAVVQQTYRVQK